MAIFEGLPVASWTVGGEVVRFPIIGQLRESGGNRIVQHERPYRPGAKLDNTGPRARTWTVQALFNNSIQEEGLGDALLYPDALRAMVASFESGDTGTLVLPTVGAVRAKAETYERIEDTQERDQGTLTLTWIEDNEEALDQEVFALPSARAVLVRLAEQTTFSAEAAGATDADLGGQPASISGASTRASLTETAAELEGLLLAPGRAVADLESQARAARWAVQRVRRAQEQLAADVDGQANDPRGSGFWRSLIRLEDTHAAAVDEKFRSLPPTRVFVVDVDLTTLFAVAARVGQDAGDLLDLNSGRIADPMFLERGAVVRVFA